MKSRWIQHPLTANNQLLLSRSARSTGVARLVCHVYRGMMATTSPYGTLFREIFLASSRDLLAELNQSLDQGRDFVYCAVVETRGSTPQKAGAAMLVFPDGSQSGTLGGGCVEAEVKQRALGVLATGEGRTEVLSFCLDDNYGWDDGLICG